MTILKYGSATKSPSAWGFRAEEGPQVAIALGAALREAAVRLHLISLGAFTPIFSAHNCNKGWKDFTEHEAQMCAFDFPRHIIRH